jgi:hypothetical protein
MLITLCYNCMETVQYSSVDETHPVVTGFSGKSADDADYSAKQAHVELAMRMR